MSEFFEGVGNALIAILLILFILCHFGLIADIGRIAKETNVLLEQNNKLLEQIEIRIVNVQNRL